MVDGIMVMGSAGGHAGATKIYKFQFLETFEFCNFDQKNEASSWPEIAWHTIPTRCSCVVSLYYNSPVAQHKQSPNCYLSLLTSIPQPPFNSRVLLRTLREYLSGLYLPSPPLSHSLPLPTQKQ